MAMIRVGDQGVEMGRIRDRVDMGRFRGGVREMGRFRCNDI